MYDKIATMETYLLQQDLQTIGVQVTTFPNGIKEAFGGLMKTLGTSRDYYGISWFDENGTIQYYAMAGLLHPEEATQHGYVTLTIPKGEYMTETLHNWMNNTDRIKDIFHRMLPNRNPGKSDPCIEWYKSDEEMICMVRIAGSSPHP